jgi:hypothetical protein
MATPKPCHASLTHRYRHDDQTREEQTPATDPLVLDQEECGEVGSEADNSGDDAVDQRGLGPGDLEEVCGCQRDSTRVVQRGEAMERWG